MVTTRVTRVTTGVTRVTTVATRVTSVTRFRLIGHLKLRYTKIH